MRGEFRVTGGKKMAIFGGRRGGQPPESARIEWPSGPEFVVLLRRAANSTVVLALGIVLTVASQNSALGRQTTPPDQKPADSAAPVAAGTGQDQAGKTAGNNGDPQKAKKTASK